MPGMVFLNLIQSEAGLGYSVDISSFNRKQ